MYVADDSYDKFRVQLALLSLWFRRATKYGYDPVYFVSRVCWDARKQQAKRLLQEVKPIVQETVSEFHRERMERLEAAELSSDSLTLPSFSQEPVARSPSPTSDSQNNAISAQRTFPTSLEQLLERQWEQGRQFLMEQAQHLDIASLLSSMRQLKLENTKLEETVGSLAGRRDHLLAVNARLSLDSSSPHLSKWEESSPGSALSQLRHMATTTSVMR